MEHAVDLNAFYTLNFLIDKKKFVKRGPYPGAPDESTRRWCESRINQLLHKLDADIDQCSNKDYVKSEFLKTLDDFQKGTNEYEEALEYLTHILTILDISPSDKNIKEWLHESWPDE
jgi:hypothetical protein